MWWRATSPSGPADPHPNTSPAARRLGGRGAERARAFILPPPGSAARPDHLSGRYGTLALVVLDLVAGEPDARGAADRRPRTTLPRRSATPCCFEAALHVDDVLTRRTHIAFEAPDRGRRAVERGRAAHGSRSGLGPRPPWSREIAHYLARLDAESAAQAMLDDASADAARAPVRDVRLREREAGSGALPHPARGPRPQSPRQTARRHEHELAACRFASTPPAPWRSARAARWRRPAAAARRAPTGTRPGPGTPARPTPCIRSSVRSRKYKVRLSKPTSPDRPPRRTSRSGRRA